MNIARDRDMALHILEVGKAEVDGRAFRLESLYRNREVEVGPVLKGLIDQIGWSQGVSSFRSLRYRIAEWDRTLGRPMRYNDFADWFNNPPLLDLFQASLLLREIDNDDFLAQQNDQEQSSLAWHWFAIPFVLDNGEKWLIKGVKFKPLRSYCFKLLVEAVPLQESNPHIPGRYLYMQR